MPRITSDQRNRILARMSEHVLSLYTKRIERQLNNESAVLYDLALPKHVRTALEVLPKNLFPYKWEFTVTDGSTITTARLSEARAIPKCLDPYHLQPDDDDIRSVMARIRALRNQEHQYKNKVSHLRYYAARCLDAFASPNKLVHHWPDILDFLPESVRLSSRVTDFTITIRQQQYLDEAREMYDRYVQEAMEGV